MTIVILIFNLWQHLVSLCFDCSPCLVMFCHKPTESSLPGGIFEPSHEIVVLFILRKLILQMRMRSHPVRLDT